MSDDFKEAKPDDLVALSETWRELSPALWAECRANGCPWLVIDFVTLGSPLSHATLLLAANESDFQRKVRQFEMPSCPPLPDHRGQITQEIQYKLKDGSPRTLRVLQHAALFAVTRWTNLYFPARRLIEGDFVGGPIAPVFGRGVKDCSLVTKVWAGMLSHTHYWTKQSLMSLQALREAMDVRCKVLRETIQKRHDD